VLKASVAAPLKLIPGRYAPVWSLSSITAAGYAGERRP
jgi:hypothetical protein